MTSLMMPAPAAATMTTMTNTAPIAVTQPGVGKPDVAKIGFITNNRQGKTSHFTKISKIWLMQMQFEAFCGMHLYVFLYYFTYHKD